MSDAALADRLAIQDVMIRYAIALDSRDWELLRTCFLPDAQVRYPGSPLLDGFEEVRPFCERALSRFRTTQHLLGNYEIAIDGDTATTAVALQASHFLPEADGNGVYTLWGTYRDRVIRTPKGWRIAERTLSTTHTERLEPLPV